MQNIKKNIIIVFVFIGISVIANCGSKVNKKEEYPDFITKNEDYYVTRIGAIPKINGNSYTLKITGLVKKPKSFNLNELKKLKMIEIPLTVECIGNSPNGPLISTAMWKGFLLYDFLLSLGIDEKATGVQYKAADGYYASHTMEQIKNNKVLCALYMNGKPIPDKHGFPLRILNPGYHGVKQPAWVTEIIVIDKPIKDYWEDRGWDCSPPMAIDSTIFFPGDNLKINVGETLEIGGAAFGGKRVKKVEISIDKGITWQNAEIVKSIDADNVWVFWKANIVFSKHGNFVVNVRATDINGNVQQENDPQRYDGSNDWPVLKIKVLNK